VSALKQGMGMYNYKEHYGKFGDALIRKMGTLFRPTDILQCLKQIGKIL
jgi:hypothetical protein